jgi:hypothetical protein
MMATLILGSMLAFSGLAAAGARQLDEAASSIPLSEAARHLHELQHQLRELLRRERDC